MPWDLAPRHKFPAIAGDESQAEKHRLARQLEKWRSAWLGRIYAVWAVLAVGLTLWGGNLGLGGAGLVLGGTVLAHLVLDARVLAVTGKRAHATFYRLLAGFIALGLATALAVLGMSMLG